MTEILPIIAPAGNDAAVRAAALACSNAGGGKVLLPAGTITLTSPLPIYPGVSYIGAKPIVTFGTSIPDSVWTPTNGTILKGDGTFDCFQANTSFQGSETPYNQIPGVEILDLVIDTFLNGINIGGHNNGGLIFSRISGLLISNCSGWGVRMTNFMHTDISGVWTRLCQNGQRYASDMTTLSPGNSRLRQLFNIIPADGRDNRLCRGIVFECGATILNEIFADRIQCNAFNRTLLTAAATMANASTSIAVPDGTKFLVGMPVTVSATANGFTANQVYIVLSVSGNNLTLGNTKNGTAISATGSTAVNILSYGFPNIEICQAPGGTATVAASNFLGLDTEGLATTAIYIENAIVNITINELPANKYADICGRTANGLISSLTAAIVDFDSASTMELSGARNTTNPPVQRTGYGLCKMVGGIPNGTYGLYFTPGSTGNGGDLQLRAGGFIYPGASIGQTHRERDSSLTLSVAWLGTIVFNGATGQTFTLPTLTDDSSAHLSSLLGGVYEVVNVSANSLTVATDGTQLFNAVAAKTSLTVATQTKLIVRAAKTSGGTLFWIAESRALA